LRAPKGFTAIELVVTIVIAGILASLAVASFGPLLANRRLREASQQVEQVIRKAQQLARTKDRTTYIRFNPVSAANPGNIYTLVTGKPCGADPVASNTDTLGQNMQILSTTFNYGTCTTGAKAGVAQQNIIAFDNRGDLENVTGTSSVNQCIGISESLQNSQAGYFVCIMTASGDIGSFFVNNIADGPPSTASSPTSTPPTSTPPTGYPTTGYPTTGYPTTGYPAP
jgi:prepilin-type N-terminal cleavage/methylation domain-containing protein